MDQPLTALLNDLAGFLDDRGVAAWLVGGAARDLAMGREPADLDLAVAGDGFTLARAYADARGAAFVPLDDERATGRVVIPGQPPRTLDLAALRAPTIEEDLRLRDFTVNALAVVLVGDGQRSSILAHPAAFLDPTGGLADLRSGALRACGPNSLHEDPVRILRAARLCATLGLKPGGELATMIRAAAPGLDGVAAERMRDELLKLLDAPDAAPWLRYLDDCGVLTRLFPELEPARTCTQPNVHFLPVLAHILEAVTAVEWLMHSLEHTALPEPEALPVAVQVCPGLRAAIPYSVEVADLLREPRAGGVRRAALLKLAILLHDVAKPQTKVQYPDGKVSFYDHQIIGADVAAAICRRLRLARHDVAYVTLIVREHMRPGQLRTSEVLTTRALVRLFRDLGDAVPDLLLHELADHLATRGPHIDASGWIVHLNWVEVLLRAYFTPSLPRREPLIDGNTLMQALGIGPGPQLGLLLREVAEAHAAGEIATREEAIRLAREKLVETD